MKMKKMILGLGLCALTMSGAANAQLAKFELDTWSIVGEYNYGVKNISLNGGLLYIPLSGLLNTEFIGEEKLPLKENYTVRHYDADEKKKLEKAGVITNCEKKREGNGLLHKASVWYDCFKNKEYQDDLKTYKSANKKVEELKDSKLSLTFNSFTHSLGKISYSAKLKGNVTSHIYKDEEEIEYIGVATVNTCMDEFGQWHTLGASNSSSTIEVLVNDLLSSENRSYIRCSLTSDQVTSKFLEMNPVLKPGDLSMEVSRYVDSVVVTNGSGYYNYPNRDSYAKSMFNRVDSDDRGETDTAKLNEAVNEYVDFIRFDYGLVLSEIAVNEMPKAQAQLKIQKFLVSNKQKIKSLLKNVTANLEGAELIDQIAVAFTVSKLYSSVAELEGKLQTVMKLDHVLR